MKRKKSLYLLIAFAAVIAGAFGYATMSRTLTIKGSAVAGPDSNNFKVFYSEYDVELEQHPNATTDTGVYTTKADIVPTFINSSSNTVAGVTSASSGPVSLDGKNAVSMIVDLPYNTFLHVGDQAIIKFKIKNYGPTGYASAKLVNFPPVSINQTYTTCSKTEGTVQCNNTPTTLEPSQTDPFTIVIEPEESIWSSGVPKTQGTTYGTMNPGEYVAYKMTITYANEIDNYVQSHFEITYEAQETPAHS